jgi:DNA invertase Pin-like site-specific DNA recombinase
MRAPLYARVSTQDQQTLGLQVEAMAAYIKGRDWDLVNQVKDVGSGAKQRPDREVLLKAVDSKGFILTAVDAARSDRWSLSDREPCTVETTCPGVFAAGDVRSGSTKRVAFAVGDGALADTCAHRVLSGL